MCALLLPCGTSGKHSVRARDELMLEAMRSQPNLSMRMTEITAAVIRPLLANLPERSRQFKRRYDEVRRDPQCWVLIKIRVWRGAGGGGGREGSSPFFLTQILYRSCF